MPIIMVSHTAHIPYNVSRAFFKPPLYKAVTFEATLSDQKKNQDGQWSPKSRKLCFCLTAAAPLVFLLWTTKIALVAQQVAQRKQKGGRTIAMAAEGLPGWRRHSGRHSDWPMDVIRGTKEAQSMVVHGRKKHRSNWYTMFTTVHILIWRPMADPCASILRPKRCVCLPAASCEASV